jgi:hypothetical protein
MTANATLCPSLATLGDFGFDAPLKRAQGLGIKHNHFDPLRVDTDAVPAGLKAQPRWLVWKLEERKGKLDKIPYDCQTGNRATGEGFRNAWSSFEDVTRIYQLGGYAGIGFAFDGTDRICGIDLDDCRHSNGNIEPWACDVLDGLKGYCEVSPSGTGVKVYVFADLRFEGGRAGKNFGPIEMYRAGRWFAVTGGHLASESSPPEIVDRTAAAQALLAACYRVFKPSKKTPLVLTPTPMRREDDEDYLETNARKYLAKMEPSVQGCNGSTAMLAACRLLFWELELSDAVARRLLNEYNARAVPPWHGSELEHKIADAQRADGATHPKGTKRRQWLDERDARLANNGRHFCGTNNHAAGDTSETPSDDRPAPQGYVFAPIDSKTFATANYRQEWLIKRCLIRGQIGILGGGKKSLKTTLAVDLVLSLATGRPFLNYFEVYRPLHVCLISGESGEYTLRDTAQRIARAKEIELSEANVLWDFKLPQMSRITDVAELVGGLKAFAVDVLVIDPLYLSLLAGATDVNAGNLYEIGPILANFTRACLAAGVTPIILHHFRKTSQAGDELDLNALAFAGVAEFARQWLLIGRRKAYEPGSGLHLLTMVAGGSAGQSGSWSVDIDEGQLSDDFTGRKWDVKVATSGESAKHEAAVKDQHHKEHEDQKRRELDRQFLATMDSIAANDEPATKNKVRTLLNWSGDKANGCVERLKLQGVIETYPVDVTSGNSTKTARDGLRRCEAKIDDRTTTGQRPDNPAVGTTGQGRGGM